MHSLPGLSGIDAVLKLIQETDIDIPFQEVLTQYENILRRTTQGMDLMPGIYDTK